MAAPFRLKTSFIPPFKINPNILQARLSDPLEALDLPQKLQLKYNERLEELRLLRQMRTHVKESDSIRNQKENLEAKRRSRDSTQTAEIERIKLIQEMMSQCQGLTDFESAKFYLEAQDWDISRAISFYSECTGTMQTRQVTVTFVLPNRKTFTASFDPSQLMWSMLPQIYEHLPEKRDFVVKATEKGAVLDEKKMTEQTYKDVGITQSATIYVEYR